MTMPKFVPRATQLLSHTLTVIFALSTFIPLGQLYYKYDYHCVLNAKLTVSITRNETSAARIGDKTVWGNGSLCHFTIFLPVFVAIHAFVWGWFTIHLIRTLKETGRELALYLMIFIAHALICVCAFVSSALLSSSSSKLCPNMSIVPPNKYDCHDLASKQWYLDITTPKRTLSPFARLTVAQVSSWIMTIMSALPCGVSIYYMVKSPASYQAMPLKTTTGVNGPLTEDSNSLTPEDDSLDLSYPV